MESEGEQGDEMRVREKKGRVKEKREEREEREESEERAHEKARAVREDRREGGSRE
jgi:hypothetical protein